MYRLHPVKLRLLQYLGCTRLRNQMDRNLSWSTTSWNCPYCKHLEQKIKMKSNSTLQEKNKQLKIEVLTGARGYESEKFSSCDSILGCMIDKVKKVTTRHKLLALFQSSPSVLGTTWKTSKQIAIPVDSKTLHLTIRIRIGLFRRPQLNNNIVASTTRAPQDTKAISVLLAVHTYTCRPRRASAFLHAMHVLIYICIACSTKGSARPSRAFFTLVHFFLAYHEQIQLIAIWRLALLSSRRLLQKRSAENESENDIKDFPA